MVAVEAKAAITGSGLLTVNGIVNVMNGSSLSIHTVSVGSQNGSAAYVTISSGSNISILIY